MNADDDIPVAEDVPASTSSHLNFPVVGIGASAGGIGALLRLFEHTPQQTGMAFVVILPLSPKHDSSIDAILRKVTRMPVLQVNEQTSIERDHIYVISPTRQLSMADGHLSVSALERPRGRHVAIDTFFRTLADVHRERSVSIVLSGTGSDGALGLRHVKERGGVTLAQSPGDAEYDGMPLAAIATGAVDFVMPVIDMPAKLVDIWTNAQRIELPTAEKTGLRVGTSPTSASEEQAEAALADIMVLLRTRTGHDFRHYKRATVLRRIERRLQVTAVPTLPAYHGYLERHVEETGGLLKDMLISVTSFFRDRDAFDALERQLDAMLDEPQHEGQKVRAWVAGCATGEEAYSVAMLLGENTARMQRPVEFQVFASDIDERAISIGRAGLYPDTISADVAPARLRQFFSREQGQYRVRKELRERVLFTTHNLLRDPPFSKLDLVCCRNLLIYLDREVQAQVLEVFHFALQPGGLLFLGTAESADVATGLFSLVDKKHRIYRSNAMLRRARYVPSLPAHGVTPLASALQAASPAERSPLADLHRRLLEQHAPASLLLDAEANILHSTERAAAYLQFAAGAPTQNLLSVIRPELRLALRTALLQARQSAQSTEAERVRIEREGTSYWLAMTCRPVEAEGAPLMLVDFDEVQATLAVPAEGAAERDPALALLEEELHRTRELLRGTVGQSTTSAEELRASNEELQAINEELRSTTEELETSKEELQSVNEELITVNVELKDKVDETGKVNDDLKNLIASTDIATIFVDRGMRIKRYTPRAAELFSLIPSDAGRPLTDIRHRLDYAQLEDDAADAFESLRVIEREVVAEDRRVFLARMLPYRTHEDVIEGAVLTFVDISATRRAEDALREREATLRLVIETTRDYAVITLDPEGTVTSWNIGAERLFGWTEAEIVGHPGALVFTPEDRAKGAPEAEMRRAQEDGRATDERWP
jgi:two-component system CheB/CheR fusion protein